ncbi:ABC transporter ATP-binding protein [Microbacterium karelineae]|uniref:ABC transporter ATP-binding protein n=1 Tax=Microbacterium karelineae TaxID=2654283 RepID=UPI0012EAD569|nr:ABC transporter ATP-binding protein [Microbacterium karelineae]
MTGLSVSGLAVAYGSERILHEIDLVAAPGELLALVGPSGCGKTTALRAIAGLERAVTGTIRIGDRVVASSGTHIPPERRRVGWVPQGATLFPHLTAAENVAYGLRSVASRRLAKRRADDPEARRLLDLVGLDSSARRFPDELSGGQAQRVALARALASRPDLVLLDEPFGALDPLLRDELRASTRQWLHAEGMTGVIVTHDQREALSVADRIAVMSDGRVLQQDTPRGVFLRPASTWVASFMGDAVLLPGRWASRGDSSVGIVRCVLGSVPAVWAIDQAPADGSEVCLLLRPEQLRLGEGAGVPGTVLSVTFTGYQAIAAISVDGAELRASIPAVGAPEEDDAVTVRVRGTALAYPAG